MNKYIFILIVIAIPFLSYSQVKEIPQTNQVSLLARYDSIFITLNNYLIVKNGIEKDNNTIFLFNLLTWNTNEFIRSKPGIYIFGIKYSDPIFYIFFYNQDQTYSISDGESINLLLNELIIFFEKNDINEHDKLIYLLGITKHLNVINDYPIDEKLLPGDWNK